MNLGSAISAYGGKEIVPVESDKGVLVLLAVARKEDCTCARSVAYADYIALNVGRAVRL